MKRISNRVEYEELISKISECLEFYEKRNFEGIIYNLTMDNGDRINLHFTPGSIAHLLGIDTEYLKSTGMFDKNSYDILKSVCNNSYKLYSMISQGHLNYENFISDFAYEKVNAFSTICGIDLYNIEFICKYAKDNSYITGYQQLEADYYIAYKAEKGLFIIGIKQNGKNYYPMTNRYIEFGNEESMKFLNTLLSNQVITMPTLSSLYFPNTGGSSRNLYLDYNKKTSKIRTLMQYNRKYGSIIDVSKGYNYALEKLIQKFDANSAMTPILNKMFASITKRVSINLKEIESEFGILPEDLKILIDNYNAALNVSINEAIDEHTKSVIAERDSLSAENRRYVAELEALKLELESAKRQIAGLQKENEGYKEREATIKRVLSI